jgi:hypothetical protein
LLENPELLAQARETFEHALIDSLDGLFDRTAERLLHLADRAGSTVECGNLLDARVALVNNGDRLKASVAVQNAELINRALHTAFHWERAHFEAPSDSEHLRLLDTSVIESKLAIDLLATQLRNAAEAELRDLNVRIAHLFGQTIVHERENPFRPYVLVNALVSAVASLGLVQEVSTVLARELIEALQADVQAIYQSLNALLDEHDISAKIRLAIRKAPPRHKAPLVQDVLLNPPPPEYAEPGQPPKTAAHALLSRWVQMKTRPEAIIEQKRQGTEANADVSLLDRVPHAGALLAETIRKLERESAMLQAAPSGSLRNYVFENRLQLTGMTKSEDEQMVVDVVAMLFEFILRDGQVPVTVRADLGRTQFMVLKHGLFDPEIFSQPHHPARRLLNRIGSVAMGFSPADPATVIIREKISKTVDALITAPKIDLELFENMLEKFDLFVDTTLQTTDDSVDRAVKVLEGAETRALGFILTSNQIGDLIRGVDVDSRLANFLVNVWARVIERSAREAPDKSAEYRAIVPRLVWSVLPKSANDSRVQMLKILPELVATLSDGLSSTNLPQEEREQFLDWLVNAHVIAMREEENRKTMELPSVEAHFEDFVQRTAPDTLRPDAMPFDPGFVSEVAKELGISMELLDHQLEASADTELSDLEQLDLDESYKATVALRLRTGIMVEFLLAGIPRRARLNWVSAMTTSILLTVEEMSIPSVISVKLFLRLISRGQVRFLEDEPMFERAVTALLRTADERQGWVHSQAAQP